jgi:hypothetical protein
VSEKYLRTAQLRERYSCSMMWIERRLRSDPSFPRPRFFGRLRHFALSELEAWEKTQPRKETDAA